MMREAREAYDYKRSSLGCSCKAGARRRATSKGAQCLKHAPPHKGFWRLFCPSETRIGMKRSLQVPLLSGVPRLQSPHDMFQLASVLIILVRRLPMGAQLSKLNVRCSTQNDPCSADRTQASRQWTVMALSCTRVFFAIVLARKSTDAGPSHHADH
jgi:hypothetical protein